MEKTLFDIKNRLYALSRTNADCIRELQNRGERVTSPEFSRYIRRQQTGPKAERILSMANQIITEWEVAKEHEQSESA